MEYCEMSLRKWLETAETIDYDAAMNFFGQIGILFIVFLSFTFSSIRFSCSFDTHFLPCSLCRAKTSPFHCTPSAE